MKKVMFAGLSLLSLVVLMACGEEETKKTQAAQQPKQQTTVQQIAVGKDAPDFTLQSMDGKEVKLSDFKGKKVYLKFLGFMVWSMQEKYARVDGTSGETRS